MSSQTLFNPLKMSQRTPRCEFRLKKRKLMIQPPWRKDNLFDFSFENPLDGKFDDLAIVKRLLWNYPSMVKKRETSYCHYNDFFYRKRTVFVSTLLDFNPTPPCPGFPCAQVIAGRTHRGQVNEAKAAQKNSLPSALVDELVAAWLVRHQRLGTAKDLLFVDVFSGFGSVSRRVQETHPEIKVYANDIVNRDHLHVRLDMGVNAPWSLHGLLAFAVAKFWPEDVDHCIAHPSGALGWLREHKVAVLFHASTPCNTYSQNGLAKHRVKGTCVPKTDEANRADAMNTEILSYLETTVLTQAGLQDGS